MNRAALNEYLIQAKIEELKDEWGAKGYHVEDGLNAGDVHPDLVLRRNGDTVVFEVTTADRLKETRASSAKMARQVLRHPNTSFHLVVTNPPRERSIEIDGLDEALLGYFRNNDPPSKLDELSSHTIVDVVEDTDVSAVVIRADEIQVKGSGSVTVDLQYGSDSEQENVEGATTRAAFPFEFDVTLDSNLNIIRVDRLEVDTSEFYE